jgi:hypothetical protein
VIVGVQNAVHANLLSRSVPEEPGKEVLARLSKWSQVEFGVSFGATTIAAEIEATEIAEEVHEVIKSIEERRPL